MNKKIIFILAFVLSLNADELSNNEIKGMVVCEEVETGVLMYKRPILDVAESLRSYGVKATVFKSGSNLALEIGKGLQKEIIEFKQINEGQLSKYNVTCFQPQRYVSKNIELTRKDGTLNFNTFTRLGYFGLPQPTEQEKEMEKERLAKEKVVKELQEQQEKDNKTQEKKVKLEKEQLIKNEQREAREKLNKKKNLYLGMIEEFESKSNINGLKDWEYAKNNLILTNEVLDNLYTLVNKLKTDLPETEIRIRNSWIISKIDKFYEYNQSVRLSEQKRFYQVYDTLIYDIKNIIENIQK